MASFIAAGFATSRANAVSSTTAIMSRTHPAPEMHRIGRSGGYDCLLSRISSGICDNASKRHLLDLERVGRRSDAEGRLRGMLADLKQQVACKAALRDGVASIDSVFEISAKAS